MWYNRHDIYIKRIGFSLIRVHRLQRENVQCPSEDKLLSQLKWPVETIYVGAQPTFNTKSQNLNQHRDWHRLTRLHDEHVYEKSHTTAALTARADTVQAGSQADLLDQGIVGCNCVKIEKDFVYGKSEKTIDRLKVAAHGIPIYNDFPAEFFSNYSPYIWGGRNIATPEDVGALMVNFCLYPGTYQPSGHLNISRAREFFVQYTSSYIGRTDASNGAEDYPLAAGESVRDAVLLFLAIAINFLELVGRIVYVKAYASDYYYDLNVKSYNCNNRETVKVRETPKALYYHHEMETYSSEPQGNLVKLRIK